MKILSRPKGAAEEYGRWSVNAYLGCPNNCQYCYLKSGPGSKTLGGDHVHLKAGIVSREHAYHVAMAEIMEHRKEIIRDGGLFFSFTSDPYLAETAALNFSIAEEAMRERIPVTFLTKSNMASTVYHHVVTGQERQLPMPEKDWYARFAAFGWTLTGCDDMEPKAHRNLERLQSMNALYAAGYKVWASLEPVIDFDDSINMFRYALSNGCRHFKIGLLTKNNRVALSHYRKKYGDRFSDQLKVFIDTIQQLNIGYGATIYWKKSIRSVVDRDLAALPFAVGADWSMFKKFI
ncbi:MAG: hypothetical protein IJ551_09705 [Prevotella sp.]|nr:hypothetical protein [Prevotella sp.]